LTWRSISQEARPNDENSIHYFNDSLEHTEEIRPKDCFGEQHDLFTRKIIKDKMRQDPWLGCLHRGSVQEQIEVFKQSLRKTLSRR
jgi:hypothetical protein